MLQPATVTLKFKFFALLSLSLSHAQWYRASLISAIQVSDFNFANLCYGLYLINLRYFLKFVVWFHWFCFWCRVSFYISCLILLLDFVFDFLVIWCVSVSLLVMESVLIHFWSEYFGQWCGICFILNQCLCDTRNGVEYECVCVFCLSNVWKKNKKERISVSCVNEWITVVHEYWVPYSFFFFWSRWESSKDLLFYVFVEFSLELHLNLVTFCNWRIWKGEK